MKHDVVAIGFDIGSTYIKIVAINNKKQIVYRLLEETLPLLEKQIEDLQMRVSQDLHMDNFNTVITGVTGYGRKIAKSFTTVITEITCHAHGVFQTYKEPGLIIDIGGQDSKVIEIDSSGRVKNFVMNDKCAAGTGRFLENIAHRLKISLAAMNTKAQHATRTANVSSTCTVFAESEVVSLISQGVLMENICKGIYNSLVERVSSMAKTCGYHKHVYLSGGVALSNIIIPLLEEHMKTKIIVSQDTQFMGALGAAVAAYAKNYVETK